MENERLLLQEQNDKLLEEEKEKLKLGFEWWDWELRKFMREIRDAIFLSYIYV